MQSYSRKEALDKQSEVFDIAVTQPVVLTQQHQPNLIIMSVDAYQKLLDRIEELEDVLLAQTHNVATENNDAVEVNESTISLQSSESNDVTEFSDNLELLLSERDRKYLISIMENPPEPSEGLKALFD